MTSVFLWEVPPFKQCNKKDDEGVAAKPSARMGGHVRRRRMCVPYKVCILLYPVGDVALDIQKSGRRNASPTKLVLATQRPDANTIPPQVKSTIDYRVIGRGDATLSTIVIGDGRAHEAIPKDSQGRFINQDGIIFQGFYFDY